MLELKKKKGQPEKQVQKDDKIWQNCSARCFNVPLYKEINADYWQLYNGI